MRRTVVIASVLLMLAAPGAAQSPGDSALHLLSRATFGVRAADLELVKRIGLAPWLDRQLAPAPDPAAEEAARRYPATVMPVEQLLREYAPPPQVPGDTVRRAPRAGLQRILAELVGARLHRAVLSERQLEEVMTQFWYNHFNVFFGKGVDRYLVADYERTAIRPHVFGRFEDMLLATARHPAMLFYLDNWQSVSIDTAAPRFARMRPNAQRPRGLNENYARELLELHTLGVDGGYTQQDVTEVARAFTGWTFTPPRPNAPPRDIAVAFAFRRELHDRGEKVVLGRTLAANRGEQDGRDVIALLASHPATARHVAHKLVERFVTDAGDAQLEAELADVFNRTRGDLAAVTRALFTSPRFQARAFVGTKVKTPFELVASALRVTQTPPVPARNLIELLRSMGELPYGAAEPTGYPAASEDWVNTGAMLARMNFGLELASARLQRGPGALQRTAAVGQPATLEELAARVLPGRDTRALVQGIRTDLAKQEPRDERALQARALGLLLGSPDFQRR